MLDGSSWDSEGFGIVGYEQVGAGRRNNESELRLNLGGSWWQSLSQYNRYAHRTSSALVCELTPFSPTLPSSRCATHGHQNTSLSLPHIYISGDRCAHITIGAWTGLFDSKVFRRQHAEVWEGGELQQVPHLRVL
jgi:hypothetical protein